MLRMSGLQFDFYISNLSDQQILVSLSLFGDGLLRLSLSAVVANLQFVFCCFTFIRTSITCFSSFPSNLQ